MQILAGEDALVLDGHGNPADLYSARQFLIDSEIVWTRARIAADGLLAELGYV